MHSRDRRSELADSVDSRTLEGPLAVLVAEEAMPATYSSSSSVPFQAGEQVDEQDPGRRSGERISKRRSTFRSWSRVRALRRPSTSLLWWSARLALDQA